MLGLICGVVETEFRRQITPQVVHDRIRIGDERVERAASGFASEVELDAALVEVPALEVFAVGSAEHERAAIARRIAARCGVLDLDDLGAQAGEEHRPIRRRGELLGRENADARERLAGAHHATGCCLIHWRAMMMRCISFVPSPMQVSGASR